MACRLAALLAVVVCLGLAGPLTTALGAVHLISITSPVHRGGYVTLSISGVPFGSGCSIRVHMGSRPLIAPGLYGKGSSFLLVHWRWRVPLHSVRGRWSVDVSCDHGGGSLHTSYIVR